MTPARPTTPRDEAELENLLTEPTPGLIEMFKSLSGDLLVLGVAGKMGPTLARMAQRAAAAAGTKRRIIGVARFSNPDEESKLRAAGIETIKGDLLDEAFLGSLPDAENVVYMAGMKFGSTGNESLTWAMNTHLPALVCRRFSRSRIAAFSTGNVYGLCPMRIGGSLETDAPNPVGEYAMSCLGRERMFEHFSRTLGTKVSLLRLNYACEMRYGVIVDLAQQVLSGTPIELAMGAFNVIWQGDANAMSLLSLAQASSPATILNIAGPEQLSVRRVCERLAGLLDREVSFSGTESADAILSNAQLSHRFFGYPRMGANELIERVALWMKSGGRLLGKPTHFESRHGKF